MSALLGYRATLDRAQRRVLAGSVVADTALGPIEYMEFGDGPPLLWVHGIVGGADQGPLMAGALLGEGFRVLSVSRFGYLRSPLPGNGSPEAQADQYAALLDALQIDRALLVGSSAGGPSSLQFALRHPDRCAALALWSMAVPGSGPASRWLRPFMRLFFGSDLLQWLILRHWPMLMQGIIGVPAAVRARLTPEQENFVFAVMESFFPFGRRIVGILNDAYVTVPSLLRRFPLDWMAVPTLVIHAADDPMPPFAVAEREAARIPHSEFVRVEDGGHLLVGHHHEVRATLSDFLRRHAPTVARVSHG